MSEVYKKCIVAPNASECASLLKKCMAGDEECIKTFNALKADYAKGLKLSEDGKVTYIRDILVANGFGPFLSSGETKADEIVLKWQNSLESSPEAEKIRANTDLINIFTYLVAFVIDPEFSGEPETMKTSSAWFSPRPDGKNRLYSVDSLETRPKIKSNDLPDMVGGGSHNMNKDISYVNKIRYIDSLNTYYNMVGGNLDTSSKCCNELTQMYKDITNNLESHGKQVEASDNRIVETMLKKFDELEHKVEQIQANINKLSSMPGANISAVLKNEQEKLKVESKYLSSQGKSLTSIIRSLFESSEQIGGGNEKVLANARAQFPPHTVSY